MPNDFKARQSRSTHRAQIALTVVVNCAFNFEANFSPILVLLGVGLITADGMSGSEFDRLRRVIGRFCRFRCRNKETSQRNHNPIDEFQLWTNNQRFFKSQQSGNLRNAVVKPSPIHESNKVPKFLCALHASSKWNTAWRKSDLQLKRNWCINSTKI